MQRHLVVKGIADSTKEVVNRHTGGVSRGGESGEARSSTKVVSSIGSLGGSTHAVLMFIHVWMVA